MAKRVELPSGEVAEFPDDMSNEEISSVIKKRQQDTQGQDQQQAQDQGQGQSGKRQDVGEGFTLEDVEEGATDALANLNVGIARFFGLPGDVGNMVGAATGGGESALPDSDEVQSWMADWNMTFEPENTPEDFGSRVIQEFGTAMVPVFGSMGRGARLVKQGIKPTLLGERAAVGSATRPGTTAAVESGAAVGAVGGGKAMEQTFPENPQAARAIGELAGGLAGGGAASLTSLAGEGAETLIRKKGFVGAATEPFTKRGAKRRATRRISEQTQDASADLDTLQEDSLADEVPDLTPAQDTADPFLAQLQRSVANSDDEAQDLLARRTANASEKLKNLALEKGDPEDVRNYLNQKLKNAAAVSAKRANEVRKAGDPATISTRVQKEVEQALDTAREMERRVWSEVPSKVTATPENARQAWMDELSDMTEGSDPAELPNILKEKLGTLKKGVLKGGKVRGETSAKALHDLYSTLGRRVQQEAKKPDGNANTIRILKKVRNNLLDDLDEADDEGKYEEALNLSRDLNAKFTEGPVGDVLGFSKSGTGADSSKMMDALMGNDGQEAKLAVKQLLKASPQSEKKVKDFIKSRFATAAIDSQNNRVNTKSAQTFMKKYEPLLKEFPDLRKELGTAIGDQQITDDLVGASKPTTESPIVRQKEAASIFLQNDPQKALGRVLNSSNKEKALGDVVKELKKGDGTGDAMKGLKASVPDYLMKKSLRSSQVDARGEPIVSGKKFIKELEQIEKPLKESGLMTDGELNRLKRIGRAFEGIENTMTTNASVQGVIDDNPNRILEIAARVGGAQAGGKLGSSSAGGSLQSAQVGSGEARRFLERLTNDKAKQLLSQAVTDKKVMEDLLTNIEKLSAKKQGQLVIDLGSRVGIPKAALTAPSTTAAGGEEEEDKQ